jgi:hypothetical protein
MVQVIEGGILQLGSLSCDSGYTGKGNVHSFSGFKLRFSTRDYVSR